MSNFPQTGYKSLHSKCLVWYFIFVEGKQLTVANYQFLPPRRLFEDSQDSATISSTWDEKMIQPHCMYSTRCILITHTKFLGSISSHNIFQPFGFHADNGRQHHRQSSACLAEMRKVSEKAPTVQKDNNNNDKIFNNDKWQQQQQ